MGQDKKTPERDSTKKKKKEFLAALKKYRYISRAAEACQMKRLTHYRWLEKDAEYKEAFEDIQYRFKDDLEERLIDTAMGTKNQRGEWELEPNMTGLIFLAKTILKNRGYSERVEVEHSGSAFNLSEALEHPDVRASADRYKQALGGK